MRGTSERASGLGFGAVMARSDTASLRAAVRSGLDRDGDGRFRRVRVGLRDVVSQRWSKLTRMTPRRPRGG